MGTRNSHNGTTKTNFSLGQTNGSPGPQIKNNSDVMEIRNIGDTDFVVARSAMIPASAETTNDIVNLLALQGGFPNITFSFDGSSPPTPGANTGAFGFCHTTGGAYTAGRIYYDSGSALILLPTSVARKLTTSSAITGTISLNANGLYALEGGSWVLKGDGGASGTGYVKTISVSYVYTDTGGVSSSTTIPDGADVLSVRRIVTTPLDSGSVSVIVDGTSDETVMDQSVDTNLSSGDEVHDESTHSISSSTAGPVTVTVNGSPGSGAGRVLVSYVSPSV